jgi:hypothetical protein
MPISESDVLKPTEPSVSEDDWPEFVLSDASVVYESNGKPANLLMAYADTPLTVHGRLETPGRAQSKHRTLVVMHAVYTLLTPSQSSKSRTSPPKSRCTMSHAMPTVRPPTAHTLSGHWVELDGLKFSLHRITRPYSTICCRPCNSCTLLPTSTTSRGREAEAQVLS